ncbi:MAG: zinc ribbon domain-containing protein [Candidatus Sifarchaeia archaeon]|jgi:hypothetical protein
MRKEIAVVGVIILVLGLVLAAAGTRTTYQSVEYTENLLDTSATVPSNFYQYWYGTFEAGDKVSGSIQTTEPANFFIFSEDQFSSWQTTYSYSLDAPSVVTRLNSQSMAFSVTIQSTDTYYLVVYNDGLTSCEITSIKVDRAYYETVERRDYTLNMIGGIMAIVGLVVVAVGATRKEVGKEAPLPTPLEPAPITPTPEPIIEPKPGFCPSCGSEVPADTEFCPHCGSAI